MAKMEGGREGTRERCKWRYGEYEERMHGCYVPLYLLLQVVVFHAPFHRAPSPTRPAFFVTEKKEQQRVKEEDGEV